MDQENRIGRVGPSVTAAIIGVVGNAKEMLSSQLTLAKLELQRELAQAKATTITVAIGVGFGVLGAISLLFMAVHLLETFTVIPLWGCFGVVGAGLALFGALLATSGRIKKKDINRSRFLFGMKKDLRHEN